MDRRNVIAALGASALMGCASGPSGQPNAVEVRVIGLVPEGAGRVFLSGNLAVLGPWNPAGMAMSGSGRQRVAVLQVPIGYRLELKITLGSWEREGLGPSGMVMPNTVADITGPMDVPIEVVDFKKDPLVYLNDPAGGGVLGRLVNWLDLGSRHLSEKRHVQIWLPIDYDADPLCRYPVVYAHDGQNLFDPRIANTGVDWGVDEAITALGKDKELGPAIVVGVWSTAQRRLEYAPTKVISALDEDVRDAVEKEFGGAILGDSYLRFLVEELKPRVDAAFRTRSGPRETFLMGASMGGLISFYGVSEYPGVFGGAACLSTHWPVAITRARIAEGGAVWRPILLQAYTAYLASSGLSPARTKIWSDYGTEGLDALYAPYQAAIGQALAVRGFADADRLQMRAYQGAEHNEASWRARLFEPLQFLLAN
jgi:enterochelin esterase-like enzyme